MAAPLSFTLPETGRRTPCSNFTESEVAEAESTEADWYCRALDAAASADKTIVSFACPAVLVTDALRQRGVEEKLRRMLIANAATLQLVNMSGSSLPFEACVNHTPRLVITHALCH